MRKERQHRDQSILLSLGEQIRSRRVELQLTQKQLAVRVDMHRTYITDLEKGLRNPAILTLDRLSDGLETQIWRLMKRAEQKG
jgi:transcriptional regulator with XRE-family HTH domain